MCGSLSQAPCCMRKLCQVRQRAQLAQHANGSHLAELLTVLAAVLTQPTIQHRKQKSAS